MVDPGAILNTLYGSTSPYTFNVDISDKIGHIPSLIEAGIRRITDPTCILVAGPGVYAESMSIKDLGSTRMRSKFQNMFIAAWFERCVVHTETSSFTFQYNNLPDSPYKFVHLRFATDEEKPCYFIDLEMSNLGAGLLKRISKAHDQALLHNKHSIIIPLHTPVYVMHTEQIDLEGLLSKARNGINALVRK